MVKPPLIIAHRGASHDAPENTLPAFRLAWTQGADAIETDLRLTADGQIVAHHDEDLHRCAGRLERLRDLDLARLRDLAPHVPTLAEVLAVVPPDKRLVLELKEPLLPELRAALADAPLDRITLIAFDAALIAQTKATLPACPALWLIDTPAAARPVWGRRLAARVRDLGVDGVDLRHRPHLSTRLLAPLRDDGRTLYTYTVNSSARVRDAALLGLHGLTTDHPADARAWLGDWASPA